MGPRIRNYSEQWRRLRSSSRFHNILIFICFIGIAVIFWFVLALNDNVTETFRVRLHFDNVPDSVTFIPDPPTDINITVRDKGTTLLRSGVAKRPVLHFNFRNYARDGVLRISSANLNAAIKNAFGNSIQIQSTSVDSIRVNYTSERGKRVPVVVRVDVSAANGYIISGPPVPLEKSVLIYSYGNARDTVNNVFTERIIARDLSQTSRFKAKIASMANIKIVPQVIEVEFPVEALVRKECYAVVETENVPEGESLLIFPNRVPVSCYVPMSLYNDNEIPLTVAVNYEDTKLTGDNRLPVKVKEYPEFVVSLDLSMDSVEYTIVRN